ncbi:DoxX family protein [Actinomadura bangladeshensis]|uniref:DoxX family protein n=1 Tax=Actinomadura bangladeshensis TaxID=453573 RepID=A0A6L9QSV4_9ACTN|nr:DoxX family protein [Actinomadura bangladeshensis]NEA28511.1 DoxX family protein [Actinomadura bangladeshensis]
MFITYVIVTAITVAINAAIVVADLAKAKFVLANSAEVGVPHSSLPLLAALKGAGAAGLVLGLLGLDVIGIVAAAGLVAFFVIAVAAHIRARVFYNIAFPGAFLALAVASLALAVTT